MEVKVAPLSPERFTNLTKDLGEKSVVKEWSGVKTIAEIDATLAKDPVAAALERESLVLDANPDAVHATKKEDDPFYKIVEPELVKAVGENAAAQSMELYRANQVKAMVRELRSQVLAQEIEAAKTTEELAQVMAQAPEITDVMKNSHDSVAIGREMIRFDQGNELERRMKEKMGELVRGEVVDCNTMEDLDKVVKKYPEIQTNIDSVQARVEGDPFYPDHWGDSSLQKISETMQEKRTTVVRGELGRCKSVGEVDKALDSYMPSINATKEIIKSTPNAGEDVQISGRVEDGNRFGTGVEEVHRESQKLKTQILEQNLAKANSLQAVAEVVSDHKDMGGWLTAREDTQVDPEWNNREAKAWEVANYAYGADVDRVRDEIVDKRGRILDEALQAGKVDEVAKQDPELARWLEERGNGFDEVVRKIGEAVGSAKLSNLNQVWELEAKLSRRYGADVIKKIGRSVSK